jgi:hypothetical protein
VIVRVPTVLSFCARHLKNIVKIALLTNPRALSRLVMLPLFFLTLSWPALACGQGTDARAFVRGLVANELKADANDHSKWMYLDDNKVPDSHTVKIIIQTAQGDLSKTLKKDGRALTADEQKEDEKKIDDFVQDASVREKQKRDHEQDSEKAAALTKLLPDAFLWTFAGRNGALTTLNFKPDPKFNPPTRESRVFAAMEGTMVAHTKQKRIKQLKGKLTHDVDFGYGLLGKLEKGGTFEIERQQIAPAIWDITQTHIHIQGHALIFKSISEEQDEVTSQYHRTPASLTLADAAKMLKDGSAERTLQQGNAHQH